MLLTEALNGARMVQSLGVQQEGTFVRNVVLRDQPEPKPAMSARPQCARSWLQRLARYQGPLAHWVRTLMQRRPGNTVACALANKLARIAWAVVVKRTLFRIDMASTVEAASMAKA